MCRVMLVLTPNFWLQIGRWKFLFFSWTILMCFFTMLLNPVKYLHIGISLCFHEQILCVHLNCSWVHAIYGKLDTESLFDCHEHTYMTFQICQPTKTSFTDWTLMLSLVLVDHSLVVPQSMDWAANFGTYLALELLVQFVNAWDVRAQAVGGWQVLAAQFALEPSSSFGFLMRTTGHRPLGLELSQLWPTQDSWSNWS